MKKHTFKAYNSRGQLVLSTFTYAPVTYQVEKDVYQKRLNRGDFAHVTIASSDPMEIDEKLIPGG